MDGILHTILATGSIIGAFYVGLWKSRLGIGKDVVSEAIEHTLDRLERDGYIETRTDRDGEKDIIKISEIRAKVLRDAYSK
ncbi:uncharacterized protein METZ01_LOCUS148436 [marine metagenome]|uniref:Uncharacterized protein n=1 Tax=marine metagenome TaxID=408172 RepID=A0A382A366_9ZZZZ